MKTPEPGWRVRAVIGAMLILTGGFAGAAQAQNFDYTAQLRGTSRVQGAVVASGITWQCSGALCRTRGPWPIPGLGACKALAAKVGAVTSYGHPGAGLAPKMIEQCNVGVAGSLTAAPGASVMKPAVAPMRPVVPVTTPALDSARLRTRISLFDNLQRERDQAGKTAQAALPPAIGALATQRPGTAGLRLRTPQRVVASRGDDCDDREATAHPDAAEICDNRDNNCDGRVDEGQTLRFYLDADGDGHGDPGRIVDACPADQRSYADSGQWLVLTGNDCNDANPDQWHDCP